MARLFIEAEDGGLLVAIINSNWTMEAGGNAEVAAWLTEGVPAIEGVVSGDVIQERAALVRLSDDPLRFNLALLDECEERGWTVREEGVQEAGS